MRYFFGIIIGITAADWAAGDTSTIGNAIWMLASLI